MITIYDKNGDKRLDVVVTASSLYHKELMGQEYVSLRFKMAQMIRLFRGDYIVTEFGRFTIASVDRPTYDPNTGAYTYEQKFHASWEYWRKRILYYSRQKGKEKAWKMTQTPTFFMQIVLENLKDEGFGDFIADVDASLTEMKLVEFDSTDILAGLSKIAETWESEWWITDNTIHLSKCSYGSPVSLQLNDTLSRLDRDASNDTIYVTRLVAFGSTRNIPTNYREDEDSDLVKEGLVEKRLKMPKLYPHIDAWEDMQHEEIEEGIVIFEDVYPRRTGKCETISTKEYTYTIEHEDGSTTKDTWNAYRFTDSGLSFKKEYVLEGQELRLVFHTGKLAGMDFAITFNPDGKEETSKDAQVFEIIRSEDYGVKLPNDSFHPDVGDEYIMYGFDIELVSDKYVKDAELELLDKARNWLTKNSEDKSVYTAYTNKVRCAGFKTGEDGQIHYLESDEIDLEVGQKVKLIDANYFDAGYKVSRIRAFEKNLDNKFNATYTIGESGSYSTSQQLEEKVEAITFMTEQYTQAIGSSGRVYVIKRNDTTQPTDFNVYSALRSKLEFVSKRYDDIVNGQITHKKVSIHEQGAQFGESFVPGLVGIGGKIYGKGNGELRSLKLWEWLEVPELRYNKVSIYIGIRWDTFGGGIIETITPDATGADTGSGTLKLDEGEIGAISVGDLCMGIWHDESGNANVNSDDCIGNFTFAGFKTVYFQITGVSGAHKENFTYLLRGQAEGGNGFHPFVGMHFAGRGNISDTERQAFTYTTTEYSVSLTGVSTWEFQPANYYEIHGHLEGFSMPAIDSQGNPYTKVFHGYGQVFGNAYMFGKIDQFERVSYRCYVEQSLGGSIAPSETEDVRVYVLNGYGEDVTSQFTLISVTRNTGDTASDALWNSQHTNVGNPFQISFSDLGIDGIHKLVATFNVTASDEATGQTAKEATATYFS